MRIQGVYEIGHIRHRLRAGRARRQTDHFLQFIDIQYNIFLASNMHYHWQDWQLLEESKMETRVFYYILFVYVDVEQEDV